LNPRSIYDRQQYAQLLEFKGEHAQAIAEWTEIMRVDNGLYHAFLRRAEIHIQQGNADAAIADCDEYLKHYQFSDAYLTRAAAYRMKGDTDRARGDIDQAVQLAEKMVHDIDHDERYADTAYGTRAKAYLAAGRLEDALMDATRAVVRGAGPHSRLIRAEVLQTMGRKSDAVDDLRRIIKSDEWNLEARQALRRLGEVASAR
jgi:tetratricopeptide (TPR) repeat protein